MIILNSWYGVIANRAEQVRSDIPLHAKKDIIEKHMKSGLCFLPARLRKVQKK